MDIITPLAAAVSQGTLVQRQQADDKSRQVARAQALRKDASAAGGDRYEHQVESCEELRPVHDEQSRDPKDPSRRKPARPKGTRGDDGAGGEKTGIDVTA